MFVDFHLLDIWSKNTIAGLNSRFCSFFLILFSLLVKFIRNIFQDYRLGISVIYLSTWTLIFFILPLFGNSLKYFQIRWFYSLLYRINILISWNLQFLFLIQYIVLIGFLCSRIYKIIALLSFMKLVFILAYYLILCLK